MQRNIIQKLLEWKSAPNRKPLIVRGARQVGKSYSIKEFGVNNLEGSLHIVNLESNPDWHSVFEKNFDVKRILAELEIFLGKRIEVGKDLLFFDEIQECPKAILCLRYFYEQMPELHVIAASSLIEFALKEISFPVGRVQLINMHPMTFYEFLLATKGVCIFRCLVRRAPRAENLIYPTVFRGFLGEIFELSRFENRCVVAGR